MLMCDNNDGDGDGHSLPIPSVWGGREGGRE